MTKVCGPLKYFYWACYIFISRALSPPLLELYVGIVNQRLYQFFRQMCPTKCHRMQSAKGESLVNPLHFFFCLSWLCSLVCLHVINLKSNLTVPLSHTIMHKTGGRREREQRLSQRQVVIIAGMRQGEIGDICGGKHTLVKGRC